MHGNIVRSYRNIIANIICASLSVFIATMCSPAAMAACIDPGGEGGDILYNADHKVMQYCNGDEWIGFPKGTAGCELPWGGTIGSGDSVTAYEAASVPYGDSCVDEQRTCDAGDLSGSFEYQSCTVNGAADCSLDGQTVAHGDSFTFYSVEGHSNCASVGSNRTCNDGSLSGDPSFQYASCETLPCDTGPVGTVCPDGAVYAGDFGGVRLYAAASDEPGTYTWNNGGANTASYVEVGATSWTDGADNTDMLVAATDAGSPYIAARTCRNKGPQWYLPSLDEQMVLYNNRDAIGNFDTSGTIYWSSTELSYNVGLRRRFNTGEHVNGLKSFSINIRCVRR